MIFKNDVVGVVRELVKRNTLRSGVRGQKDLKDQLEKGEKGLGLY